MIYLDAYSVLREMVLLDEVEDRPYIALLNDSSHDMIADDETMWGLTAEDIAVLNLG